VSAVAQETIDVRIRLADLNGIRWPKRPLVGDGERRVVPVLLPGPPWSRASVDVPLGATAARKVERVTTLRTLYGRFVVPLIVLLFVVADVILVLGLIGTVRSGRPVIGVLGGAGFVLVLVGLLPNAYARLTRSVRTGAGWLHLPDARADAVREVTRLNRKGVIETR
jgi:hypothetical protein